MSGGRLDRVGRAAPSRVSKADFEQREASLRLGLLEAQQELRERPFGALVLVCGDDRPGCEAWVDRMHEWLDARRLELHAFPIDDPDRERMPGFWRYWCAVPAHGTVTVHLTAWPMAAIADRLAGRIDPDGFMRRLARIEALERSLLDDGTTLVKLWIHQPHEELDRRLKKARKKPDKIWDVEELDYRIFRRWDDGVPLVEQLLEATGAPRAPWHVIDGRDDEARDLEAGGIVLRALQARLRPAPIPARAARPAALPPHPGPGPGLAELERGEPVRVPAAEYRERRDALQAGIARLSRAARAAGTASLVLLEGPDAAGKGGAIRRLIRAMAARDYRVVPIAAPDERERAHHWLWRFWTRLPGPGRMLILDRSWYGRVLVERVEGFADEPAWRRAYGEINELEAQLVEQGMPLCKLWLHIDPPEQLRRFLAREATAHKRHKITDEDHRNRARWPDYRRAADEMFARTSTAAAPWTLVDARDKRHARLRVLETVHDALEAAVG